MQGLNAVSLPSDDSEKVIIHARVLVYGLVDSSGIVYWLLDGQNMKCNACAVGDQLRKA